MATISTTIPSTFLIHVHAHTGMQKNGGEWEGNALASHLNTKKRPAGHIGQFKRKMFLGDERIFFLLKLSSNTPPPPSTPILPLHLPFHFRKLKLFL